MQRAALYIILASLCVLCMEVSFAYTHDHSLISKDSDGDGVSDLIDECPGTGPGIEVDKKGCAKDSDEDGLINTLDRCPFIEGDVSAEGCPDRDGDGVEDKDDKCPYVAGEVIQLGCPDIDGDGIVDRDDKCPDLFGSAKTNGCPDKDNDGVLDDSDDCPFIKGAVTNGGCPTTFPEGRRIAVDEKKLFDKALKEVKFIAGKTELQRNSYSILDQVVNVLNENDQYNVLILGYTDSNGSDSWNLKLSEQRAQIIKKYLVKNKISDKRIIAVGKGESDPISSNKTWKGREANRRIEFRIY